MQKVSHQEFVQLYEKPAIPVVINGLQDAWQAQKLWNKEELEWRFGNHKFKVLFYMATCLAAWTTMTKVTYVNYQHATDPPIAALVAGSYSTGARLMPS